MTNCLHGGEHEFDVDSHNCENHKTAFEVKTLCIYCGKTVRSLLICQSNGEIKCEVLETKLADEPEDNECNTEPQFDKSDRD